MNAIEYYSYEIDENNTVRVWDNRGMTSSTPPFILQPNHPDGSEWKNSADAETWAVNFINDMLAGEAAYLASQE